MQREQITPFCQVHVHVGQRRGEVLLRNRGLGQGGVLSQTLLASLERLVPLEALFDVLSRHFLDGCQEIPGVVSGAFAGFVEDLGHALDAVVLLGLAPREEVDTVIHLLARLTAMLTKLARVNTTPANR